MTRRHVVGTVLAGPALGAVCGVLWHWWWTPPAGVALEGEFVYTSAGLDGGFSGTGLYVLVAAVAGLLLGVVTALRADGREVPALLALVVSSAAAAAVMGVVGRLLGPADADVRAAGAADYAPLVADLQVEAAAAWLTLPTAALVGAAVVFLLLTQRSHPGDHIQPRPAGRDR